MQSYVMNTLLFGVVMLGILFFANREISTIVPEQAATQELVVDDLLMGHRSFDGRMRFGQLTFHGAAFTFEDKDDPSTFVPYNFAYLTDRFSQTPRMDGNVIAPFYAQYDAAFSIDSGVLTDTCVNPRQDETEGADSIALKNPILCQIASALPDQAPAMIGVLQSEDPAAAFTDADATCRAEIALWRNQPGFEEIKIMFCAIVDGTGIEDGQPAGDWMDVIVYQQISDVTLATLRGAGRNM
ncbi:hypothetical protein [Yoonia sp. BS5-3]|uniref:Uncharacterized protein n=1 Tax=Yoonia phaeophyticola TaxID=3137369 RepID=A0ABZ2V2Q2_9RHOB